MSKFKVGHRVLYLQWRNIKKWWPYVVVNVLPKKWYQLQHRYIIQDPVLPKDILTAKEKHLVHNPTPTVKGETNKLGEV